MPGNGVDESCGWFPTSFDTCMSPPVEGTISDNKKITNNNKTKVLLSRRPSGIDHSAATPSNILNDIPVVTSPTQPTGINRLPSTELKRQMSDIEQLPVSCQSSGGMKRAHANSIADLPRRPGVPQNIKRVHSSNNVAKPTQDKSTVHDKKSTPSEKRRASSNQSTAVPQQRGKLQKSYTTPGKLEDLGKPSPPTKKIK